MPIFNGGANQANLDAAMIQKDIGVAQYQKAIQTAFREVADGLAARGTYTDQLAALRRNADDQQRRLELANLRFTSGIDSYLNVLTAQTDLYNAQITLVSTRLGQLTSLVDLYRALGGGWLERSASEPGHHFLKTTFGKDDHGTGCRLLPCASRRHDRHAL
jgi:multidrug efflux system outer membrane protein